MMRVIKRNPSQAIEGNRLFKLIALFLLLLLAIPGVMAALQLNALPPSEADICDRATFLVYANNTGIQARNTSLNITMPDGFAYNPGSTEIVFPGNLSLQEPAVSGQYLNWTNSSWVLEDGQYLKIQFKLTAGCGAPSGKNLVVNGRSSNGPAATFNSPSILVNSGLLKITKEPNVIEAGKGDRVNWTIKIDNQGTGAAYNVLVNDTPRSGLQLLAIDSPGGLLNWSYSKIDPGEIKTVNTSFRVIGCNNLVNLVNASWGCSKTDCQKTHAKGSIKLVPREPDIHYTINPSPIVVPYCGNETVTITLTNSGLGNASRLHMHLLNYTSPYRINDVSGAVYFENNNTFFLGDLPPGAMIPSGGSKTFSFNFSMPTAACSAKGNEGLLDFRIDYFDDCNNSWFPPVSMIAYSMEAGSIPGISVSKKGAESLYLGETGKYLLGISYDRGNCGLHSLPNNTIVDRYPETFEVVNAAGGTVDQASHSITWTDEPLNDTTPWSRTVYLKAAENATCNCGGVFINDFSVNASQDCCGCPLSASTPFPVIVKCFNSTVLAGSNKTAAPNFQENCRQINYTNIYVFNQTQGLGWKDISFIETAANGQAFPGGGHRGNATFTVNNLCINQSPINLSENNNLSFLNDTCGPLQDGDVLKISYNLSQPRSGSFVDWSSLCVKGFNSGCPKVPCFQEGVPVDVNQADYSLGILGMPHLLSPCQSFNLTLNLAKNSPDDDPYWIAHNMNITYNDLSYRYIGPTSISGIINQSGPVQSFEPRRTGSGLTWELGTNVSRGGNITFKVEKSCPDNLAASAALNYIDNCGALMVRTATSSPFLLTRGDLIILKTPETVYTLDRSARWKIYVTNRGSGTAYNVTVVDRLDSDLNYSNSQIRRCLSCPFQAEPLNTSVNNRNPCGPDTVTWRIGDLAPKQQVVIDLNATLCGCLNRNNNVYATIACGGNVCQNIRAASRVEMVDSQLLVARHDAGKVDDCGADDPFSIEIRNAGEYVYNLTIKEQLPAGLKLNSTPLVSGAALSSADYSNPGILIWRFNQSEGISPGTRISIKFNASVTGACDFKGGDSRVTLNYIEPCGREGPVVESRIPLQKYQPLLTIAKTPSTIYASSGDVVRWTISLGSTGDRPAQNVTLKDVLPSNTVWHSAYPENDSGKGTMADPLVWSLADIPAGETRIVRLNATIKSCDATTTDRATISWGCCPSTPILATASLVTRPSASASPDIEQLSELDTCGGDVTLVISNTGARALVANITNVLPLGFVYKKNSAQISSNNATHNAAIIRYEPLDFTSINGSLIWNSSNIDSIYRNEVITIRFMVVNCTGCCKSVTTGKNILGFHYLDTCGNLYSTDPNVQSVTPKKSDLSVRKEPAVQFLGRVSWTIYIDNNGSKPAENVSVVDVLGDGFFDVIPGNGTLIHNQPLPNWTTIRWTGQKVPVGTGKWSVTVAASSNETCGLAHTNNVTVIGNCSSGCIYSNDSAMARALSVATFELDSLETLLRGQTDLIFSFESLLKNTTQEANVSSLFLASFDDLSERQQTGLASFDGLVRCNWNDLDESQKIRFTLSFEDLLRRQALIITKNDALLQRSYCQLNDSQKTIFLARLEDRLHREQHLLTGFYAWVESQRSLNSTQKDIWYQLLAGYEDLIRRQARLIAGFQEIMHSGCDGTFFSVSKNANLTDAASGRPINYTIFVNNTGTRTIKNITINDSILGVIESSPGFDLLPGQNKTFSRVASHSCKYCDGCICRICDFALVCGDVYRDAANKTHVCIISNEVCLSISQPSAMPVYPG